MERNPCAGESHLKLKFWKKTKAEPEVKKTESQTNNVNRQVEDVRISYARGMSDTFGLEVTGWNSKEAMDTFKEALAEVRKK